MSFASDNSVGVCPQILDAMARANDGFSDSYGEDGCTKALQDRFSALFERRCYVFPVATGTAANALALAAITPPWGRILCHEYSHIEEHECGAPEFFTGGARLHRLGGADGRLDVRTVQALLGLGWQGNVHRAQPSALSFSNVTEMGTCYGLDALAGLCRLAHDHGMVTHLDGARFAGAVAALGASAAEASWKAGIDILAFGATKGGACAAEAVICFDAKLAERLHFLRKRSGHLFSKMRFLSAQLLGYLEDDLWLANARHANEMAAALGQGLGEHFKLLAPIEANMVFVELDEATDQRLQDAGFAYYPIPECSPRCKRLVTSWATRPEEVRRFIEIACA